MNLILIVTLSITTAVFAKTRIIYGEDNRVDISEVQDQTIQKISKAIAGRVLKHKITEGEDKGSVNFSGVSNLGDPWGANVCSDENFANQPMLSDCTGFLVGDDLLVTAGHCIASSGDTIEDSTTRACDDYAWVFDFKKNESGSFGLEGVDQNNVYNCAKVIKAVHKQEDDYAIIKLDRKVEGREPLKLRSTKTISVDTKLYVIGHPSGLPMKFANGARVFNVQDNYFSTNLDTFGGNSGSPVFNELTNEVEGILVRGDVDYVMGMSDGESCRRVNTCDNNRENCEQDNPGIDGEHVSKISKITSFL